MNKFAANIVGIVALSSLSACNQTVQIQDGKIPAAALPQAQALVGKYVGYAALDSSVFAKRTRGELTIRIDGGRPSIDTDFDFAGEGCGSKFGALKSVYVNSAPFVKLTAYFEFDPGRCADRVLGRVAAVDLTSTPGSSVLVSVVQSKRVVNRASGPRMYKVLETESILGHFKKL